MAAPRRFGEEFKNHVVGLVGVFADFLHHDLALLGEFLVVERRMGENVRENIGAEFEIVFEDARVIAGALLAGGGVEIAAHPFDLFGDGERRALFRALERHVFEKMRDAVLARRLIDRAGAHRDAEGHGCKARHRIDNDAHAVRKRMNRGHRLVPNALRTIAFTAAASAGACSIASGRSKRSA